MQAPRRAMETDIANPLKRSWLSRSRVWEYCSLGLRAGSMKSIKRYQIGRPHILVGGAKKNTGKTDHRYNFGANPCVCFSGAAALRAEERERECKEEKSNIPTEKIQ